MKIGDDALARRLRKQEQEYQSQRAADRTECGRILQERAAQEAANDLEQRRRFQEKKKEEAKEAEERKIALEKASAERQAIHNRSVQLRLQEERVRFTKTCADEYQRWLQLVYPVEVALRCVTHFREMQPRIKKAWKADLEEKVGNVLSNHVNLPHLWKPAPGLTSEWGSTATWDNGARRKVKCGQDFQRFLEPLVPPPRFAAGRDASEALLELWKLIVPCARDIFTGPYSPARAFAHCDYIMEGAFIFGAIVLSKLLGFDKFPCGVYGNWPPALPRALRPQVPGCLMEVIE